MGALLLAGCGANASASRQGSPATSAEIGGDAATAGPAASAAPTTSTTAFEPTTTTGAPDLRAVPAPVCPGNLESGAKKGGTVGRSPSTTEYKPTTTTTAKATTTTAPPGSEPATTTTIADPRGAIDAFEHDPRVAGTNRSISVWIEGQGEAAAENPDSLLIPASNQKLITAIGAYTYLDMDEKLRTSVVATGPTHDGVLDGDLVLVGGGDPVVTRTGPHSIDFLAEVIARTGLKQVNGRILVDESRYDTVRTGPNWPADWLYSIGPMSALGVDHDMITKDRAYVDDPAKGNGEVLKFALASRGIGVSGGVEHGRAEQGVEVAGMDSPPIKNLLTTMLLYSDNFIAELMVKEIAFRQSHQPGSTAVGMAAINKALTSLCGVPITSNNVDGSGLSRDAKHSAREFRRLLQLAELQPWGDAFVSGLSIAGEDDAIGGRLNGPATAGRLRAKGGFLFVSRSLSGYLTTTDGRHVVFSIIVNGSLQKADNKVEGAMDDFLTNIASLPP